MAVLASYHAHVEVSAYAVRRVFPVPALCEVIIAAHTYAWCMRGSRSLFG